MDLFVIDTERDDELLGKDVADQNSTVSDEEESDEDQNKSGQFVRLRKPSESSEKSDPESSENEEAEATELNREYDYCGIPSPSHDISDFLQEFLDELAIKEATEKPKLSKKDQLVKDAFDNDPFSDIFKPIKKATVKNENFLTTGIEFTKDVKALGMSDSRRKKLNRVSVSDRSFRFITATVMILWLLKIFSRPGLLLMTQSARTSSL
jgi:hypothetical protein